MPTPLAEPAILLTGASGYIGRRLLAALLEAGEAVICLQHRNSLPPACSQHPRCQAVMADLADPACRAVLAGLSFDRVIHLAAVSRAAPATLQQLNVGGTRHLLEAARTAGVRHCLLVSSQDAVHAVRTRYGDSKSAAEQLLRDSGLPYSIVRPGLVYGGDGGALAQLGRFACRFHCYPRPGSGKQPWQPVHVDDVAALLQRVMAGPPVQGVLSIAGSRVLPQAQVLATVVQAAGARALPVPLPLWLLRCLRGLATPSPLLCELIDKLRLNAAGRTLPDAAQPHQYGLPQRGFPEGL